MPTGYGYVLPDQNGWSRYLHFQAAWVLVFTGLLYVIFGLLTGHLRKNLLPSEADLSWRAFSTAIASHLRFERPSEAEAWSYNVLQRLSLPVRDLRSFPVGHLDGPGDVSRVCFRVSGDRQCARRPAIGAHASLLRLPGSRALPAGPRRDGLSCRILEPHAGDDHGPRRSSTEHTWSAHERIISRRKLITTGLAATAGVAGLGVAARTGAKVWTDPARSRRNLRPRRNADLCLPAAADEALVSARVLPQPDFEASVRERNRATE